MNILLLKTSVFRREAKTILSKSSLKDMGLNEAVFFLKMYGKQMNIWGAGVFGTLDFWCQRSPQINKVAL